MYYDSHQFEFVDRLESNWLVIKDELSQLTSEDFVPYPEKYLLQKKTGWEIFGIYFLGVKIDINCELCPETANSWNGNSRLFSIGTGGAYCAAFRQAKQRFAMSLRAVSAREMRPSGLVRH